MAGHSRHHGERGFHHFPCLLQAFGLDLVLRSFGDYFQEPVHVQHVPFFAVLLA